MMLFDPLHHSGINDLKASLTHLQNQPVVDANRVGAIGFCMGGSFAISWACTDERLKVIAPFYGMNPRPLEATARACPVVGSYPENDFSAGLGRKLDAELDKHNIRHDIKIYPGATHSFFNGRRSSKPENEAAAQDSWERVLQFFGEQFKS
jgi:carboxymethylenebutenolidase